MDVIGYSNPLALNKEGDKPGKGKPAKYSDVDKVHDSEGVLFNDISPLYEVPDMDLKAAAETHFTSTSLAPENIYDSPASVLELAQREEAQKRNLNLEETGAAGAMETAVIYDSLDGALEEPSTVVASVPAPNEAAGTETMDPSAIYDSLDGALQEPSAIITEAPIVQMAAREPIVHKPVEMEEPGIYDSLDGVTEKNGPTATPMANKKGIHAEFPVISDSFKAVEREGTVKSAMSAHEVSLNGFAQEPNVYESLADIENTQYLTPVASAKSDAVDLEPGSALYDTLEGAHSSAEVTGDKPTSRVEKSIYDSNSDLSSW